MRIKSNEEQVGGWKPSIINRHWVIFPAQLTFHIANKSRNQAIKKSRNQAIKKSRRERVEMSLMVGPLNHQFIFQWNRQFHAESSEAQKAKKKRKTSRKISRQIQLKR